MKTSIILVVLCCNTLVNTAYGQVDTTRIKREQQQKIQQMKAAQEQAILQMKQMGITIDPKKKMTKEEAEQLKVKLTTKANQTKQNMPELLLKKRTQTDFKIKEPVTKESVTSIAAAYFKRSYAKLTASDKIRFDNDFKAAQQQQFSTAAIYMLVSKGNKLAENNYNSGCTYLSSAVKNQPQDTSAVNNFGAFLLRTDSLNAAVNVLYYANKLSPHNINVITNLGHAFLYVNDFIKAEKYTREAIQYNLLNGDAHALLCEILIYQNRRKEAVKELFDGLRYKGCSYELASRLFYSLTNTGDGNQQKQSSLKPQTSGITNGNDNDNLAPLVPPDDPLAPLVPPDGDIAQVLDEIKNQLSPPDALASLVPDEDDVLAPLVAPDDKIKLQDLPLSGSAKAWMEYGGFSGAFSLYQDHLNKVNEFEQEFKMINQQGVLQDKKIINKNFNQRFAIDCIAEMFAKESAKERRRYDAQTKNLYRCEDYKPWEDAFKQTVDKQQKILDDFYGFAEPWLKKISDPYWNKVYTYKIKRIALLIVGNCYVQYPKPFPTDCKF